MTNFIDPRKLYNKLKELVDNKENLSQEFHKEANSIQKTLFTSLNTKKSEFFIENFDEVSSNLFISGQILVKLLENKVTENTIPGLSFLIGELFILNTQGDITLNPREEFFWKRTDDQTFNSTNTEIGDFLEELNFLSILRAVFIQLPLNVLNLPEDQWEKGNEISGTNLRETFKGKSLIEIFTKVFDPEIFFSKIKTSSKFKFYITKLFYGVYVTWLGLLKESLSENNKDSYSEIDKKNSEFMVDFMGKRLLWEVSSTSFNNNNVSLENLHKQVFSSLLEIQQQIISRGDSNQTKIFISILEYLLRKDIIWSKNTLWCLTRIMIIHSFDIHKKDSSFTQKLVYSLFTNNTQGHTIAEFISNSLRFEFLNWKTLTEIHLPSLITLALGKSPQYRINSVNYVLNPVFTHCHKLGELISLLDFSLDVLSTVSNSNHGNWNWRMSILHLALSISPSESFDYLYHKGHFNSIKFSLMSRFPDDIFEGIHLLLTIISTETLCSRFLNDFSEILDYLWLNLGRIFESMDSIVHKKGLIQGFKKFFSSVFTGNSFLTETRELWLDSIIRYCLSIFSPDDSLNKKELSWAILVEYIQYSPSRLLHISLDKHNLESFCNNLFNKSETPRILISKILYDYPKNQDLFDLPLGNKLLSWARTLLPRVQADVGARVYVLVYKKFIVDQGLAIYEDGNLHPTTESLKQRQIKFFLHLQSLISVYREKLLGEDPEIQLPYFHGFLSIFNYLFEDHLISKSLVENLSGEFLWDSYQYFSKFLRELHDLLSQEICSSEHDIDPTTEEQEQEQLPNQTKIVEAIFRGIKACCSLLNHLVHGISHGQKSSKSKEDMDNLFFDLSGIFLTLIQDSRHHGVINCAQQGLTNCFTLLNSMQKKLKNALHLPRILIVNFLSEINPRSSLEFSDVPSSPSIVKMKSLLGWGSLNQTSRRSEAVSMILKGIIKSDKNRLRSWVQITFDSVFSTCNHVIGSDIENPPSPEVSATTTHGLNLLTSLLQDSRLSNELGFYQEDLCIMSLKGLRSKNWMIRTCCLRLFSAVLVNMGIIFSELLFRDDENLHKFPTSRNPFFDFASCYPNLFKFCRSELQSNSGFYIYFLLSKLDRHPEDQPLFDLLRGTLEFQEFFKDAHKYSFQEYHWNSRVISSKMIHSLRLLEDWDPGKENFSLLGYNQLHLLLLFCKQGILEYQETNSYIRILFRLNQYFDFQKIPNALQKEFLDVIISFVKSISERRIPVSLVSDYLMENLLKLQTILVRKDFSLGKEFIEIIVNISLQEIKLLCNIPTVDQKFLLYSLRILLLQFDPRERNLFLEGIYLVLEVNESPFSQVLQKFLQESIQDLTPPDIHQNPSLVKVFLLLYPDIKSHRDILPAGSNSVIKKALESMDPKYLILIGKSILNSIKEDSSLLIILESILLRLTTTYSNEISENKILPEKESSLDFFRTCLELLPMLSSSITCALIVILFGVSLISDFSSTSEIFKKFIPNSKCLCLKNGLLNFLSSGGSKLDIHQQFCSDHTKTLMENTVFNLILKIPSSGTIDHLHALVFSEISNDLLISSLTTTLDSLNRIIVNIKSESTENIYLNIFEECKVYDVKLYSKIAMVSKSLEVIISRIAKEDLPLELRIKLKSLVIDFHLFSGSFEKRFQKVVDSLNE